MDIRQIRYFLAVEETGTFTKAADKIFVSQPALSAGIKSLEEQLGVRLFVRGKKHVSLTDAGKKFKSHAERIVSEFLAAKGAFDNEQSSQIKLGVFSTFMGTSLASMLHALKKAHPDLAQIKLVEGTAFEIARMLGRGQIDIALTALTSGEAGTMAVELFEEHYVAVMASNHPLANKTDLSVRDLDGETFIQRNHCESFRDAYRIFQEHGSQPNVVCHTTQDSWALKLVQAGMGVTVIPYNCQLNGVVQRKLQELTVKRTIGLQWTTRTPCDELSRLIEFAKRFDWNCISYIDADEQVTPADQKAANHPEYQTV